MEYNVLVVSPIVPDKTKGGVILADETKDRQGDALELARLIAVSPVAFNYEAWPEGSNPPQVGDIVMHARFAGRPFTGKDGREYRLMKDKDIGAVIE